MLFLQRWAVCEVHVFPLHRLTAISTCSSCCSLDVVPACGSGPSRASSDRTTLSFYTFNLALFMASSKVTPCSGYQHCAQVWSLRWLCAQLWISTLTALLLARPSALASAKAVRPDSIGRLCSSIPHFWQLRNRCGLVVEKDAGLHRNPLLDAAASWSTSTAPLDGSHWVAAFLLVFVCRLFLPDSSTPPRLSSLIAVAGGCASALAVVVREKRCEQRFAHRMRLGCILRSVRVSLHLLSVSAGRWYGRNLRNMGVGICCNG